MAATTLSMVSSILCSSAGAANVTEMRLWCFKAHAILLGENLIKDTGRFQTTRTSVTVLSFGRHQCPNLGYHRRESAQALPRRRVRRARAAQEDESTSQETPTIPSPPPPASPPPAAVVDKKAAAKAEIQKGQATAIVTGAISVLLAVGYLVLVQLLDTRGVNLVPPPPEAFDP